MSLKRIPIFAFAALAAGISCGTLYGQAASAAPLYTADQAQRGKDLYAKQCAMCHGPELQGVGQWPPLTGDEFVSKYTDESILILFNKIQKTMPATSPGSLTRPQAADILAYILSVSKYKAGTVELPSEEDSLKKLQLTKP